MPDNDRVLQSPLEAMQAVMNLNLCLKVLKPSCAFGTALLPMAAGYSLHTTEFCKEVKTTCASKCIECDLRTVPERCERERKIFLHTCHADACEIIIPIFNENILVAVGYLGQFRKGSDQPLELPYINAKNRRTLMSLARMIQAYLTEGLRKTVFARQSSQAYRQEAIASFMRRNIRQNPDLGQLAKHLGISASRAGHAVREATGSSFVELRDSLRCDHAKSLLMSTYYKVSHIAAECGFSSPEYFHRFFRRVTGLTPHAFRKQHHTEA